MTSLKDVDFVMPRNSNKASIVVAIPKLGKSPVSQLKEERNGFWTGLHLEFHHSVGIMEGAVVPYGTLESATNALLEDIESQEGQLGKEAVDKVSDWADGFAEQAAVWASPFRLAEMRLP